jgi:DNA polymerase III epsilon subunit-like protein
MSLLFYVIDTETTGLKAGYNEMTEVGIIRCTDRLQLWRQIKCEYPERANFDALAITKKTLADLEMGHPKEAIVSECLRFFNEDGATPAHRCIVAHNAAFDRRFLHALWEACGETFPAHLWVDTMALTKDHAKKAGLLQPNVKQSFKLHDSCNLIGIKKFADAHNAKVDSRNTYLLFNDLVNNKKVNYLPHIKTVVHQYVDPAAALAALDDDETGGGLDPALLDID